MVRIRIRAVQVGVPVAAAQARHVAPVVSPAGPARTAFLLPAEQADDPDGIAAQRAHRVAGRPLVAVTTPRGHAPVHLMHDSWLITMLSALPGHALNASIVGSPRRASSSSIPPVDSNPPIRRQPGHRAQSQRELPPSLTHQERPVSVRSSQSEWSMIPRRASAARSSMSSEASLVSPAWPDISAACVLTLK